MKNAKQTILIAAAGILVLMGVSVAFNNPTPTGQPVGFSQSVANVCRAQGGGSVAIGMLDDKGQSIRVACK